MQVHLQAWFQVWKIAQAEFSKLILALYTGLFGKGGSIARNPFSRQFYAPPKFLELLTWQLSWAEVNRQYNTTSEA